jgi:hypothetical protein
MRIAFKLVPPSGWESYALSAQLQSYLLELVEHDHWRYMNFTAGTMIVESHDPGASVYLAFDENDKVTEAVAYPPDQTDVVFVRVWEDLMSRFELRTDAS